MIERMSKSVVVERRDVTNINWLTSISGFWTTSIG